MNEKHSNLDRESYVVSVEPKKRRVVARVFKGARRAGFNRSKFIVMAIEMLGVDMGLVDKVDNENNTSG